LGRPLDTSLLGSHNFMVTALGTRVVLRLLRVEIERSTILQPTCEEKSGLKLVLLESTETLPPEVVGCVDGSEKLQRRTSCSSTRIYN
jgi:hypothetical protein